MKEQIAQKIKKALHKTDEYFVAHPVKALVFFSLALCFVIECLGRHSLFWGIAYIFNSPMLFAFNSLIIMLTLTPSLFVRRRYFYLSLLTATWLGLGISNCVVLSFRITPLGFIDIILLKSVWSIIHVYLNAWQLVLIFIAFALMATAL